MPSLFSHSSQLISGSSEAIPAMRFNAPVAFEFSAVPLLLQRLPAPPPLLQLLTNSTRLDELGISLLMHVRMFSYLMTSTGFATSSTRNISALNPCRIDNFGPFRAEGQQHIAVSLNYHSTNSSQPAGFTRFRDAVRRWWHRHSTIGFVTWLQRFIEIPKIIFCLWKHYVVRVCSIA